MIEEKEFTTAERRDQQIIDAAIHFTIVCFRGVGKYDRAQRTTLKKARLLAKKLASKNERRYLIYAVNSKGNSAYVETVTKE